jgi:hypothetical protein
MLIILLDEWNVTNAMYLVLMHQGMAATVAVDILEHQEVGIEDVAAVLLMAVMLMMTEAMEAEAIAIVIAHMVMIKDIEGKINRTIDKIVGKILDIFHTKIFWRDYEDFYRLL